MHIHNPIVYESKIFLSSHFVHYPVYNECTFQYFHTNLTVKVWISMNITVNLSAALWTHKDSFSFFPEEGGGSGLSKLTFAMNDMEGLPAYLSPERFPGLAYLNIRKTKLSSNAFIALSGLVTAAGLPLSTLVLDGLKLSGTETLKNLCGKFSVLLDG